MALETALSAKYELLKVQVRSSTQISSRVSLVLSKLSTSTFAEDQTIVIALKAPATAVNKLVSIVEIVKRQRKSDAATTYQYNALSSELIDLERKDDTSHNDSDEDENSLEARNHGEDRANKRAVPVMTIYLSASAVLELRNEYGEQET